MITIQDKNGDDVDVFVALHGGMVDAICRATDEAAFEAAALSQNIYVKEMETITDENGVQVEQPVLDENGQEIIRPAQGVNVDVIGPAMVTAGTYDADGNELTPPVMDTRYHVNLRIAGQALVNSDADGYPNWKTTAITWTVTGVDDAQVNASESAKILSNVGLIDPESIWTPQRVWL